MITHRVITAYNEYVKDNDINQRVTIAGLRSVLTDWTPTEVVDLHRLIKANSPQAGVTVHGAFVSAFGVAPRDRTGQLAGMWVTTPVGQACWDCIECGRQFLEHHRLAFAGRPVLRKAVMHAVEDIIETYVNG